MLIEKHLAVPQDYLVMAGNSPIPLGLYFLTNKKQLHGLPETYAYNLQNGYGTLAPLARSLELLKDSSASLQRLLHAQEAWKSLKTTHVQIGWRLLCCLQLLET
jgi:hypothetical protein